MTTIRIVDVSKSFGATRAVDRVSLTIASGELFFLLGPSGCGKTTLLRMLAGFITPDAGEIHFDDQAMKHVPPRKRNTGMVFQSYALWPHRTVSRNVSYGLEVRRRPKAEIARRVGEALKLVRLEGLEERRPAQLSGGQQQRVALARALVIEPRVLLLDEPLSNLDARLRLEMREEIRRIHNETHLTMVYVTHDQKEALSLADRIAIMQEGRLVQVGEPKEIYSRPLTRFVADFIGDSNFIHGTVREAGANGRVVVQTALGELKGVWSRTETAAGKGVICSIRPEAISLSPRADRGHEMNFLTAAVERVSFLGEVLSVELRANGVPLVALGLQGGEGWRPGENVALGIPANQVMVLPE